LLAGARAVLRSPPAERFLLIQHGGGASSFAKSLCLEQRGLHVCLADVPPTAAALGWARSEGEATVGYREVHLDPSGRRRIPVLRALALDPGSVPLGPDDVVVVTGGGKGIGAECALSLAKRTGARLAILGRSEAGRDGELDGNLGRLRASGVPHLYVRADVTDAAAVREAMGRIRRELGGVTAILHSAGRNEPTLLRDLDEQAMLDALRPKVVGFRNVLAGLDEDELRLLVTFGSIIGRTGLPGEAHYALANEWMGRLVEEVAAQRPQCRCLQIDWSIWSGTGMGERLGTVESLRRRGVSPISIDEGVEMLEVLLASFPLPPAVVVTGRFGALPTLAMRRGEPPAGRFLELIRVSYPGIELVADAELSPGADPYLRDHRLDGIMLVPAAMALEAMAQVAAATLGTTLSPVFSDVELLRPITVPEEGSRVVRLAAVARGSVVTVAIRSDETEFQVDHVRAVCAFGEEAMAPVASGAVAPSSRLLLDPPVDLYGHLLFQGRRFQRLRGYRRLGATTCVAEVDVDPDARWFSDYRPADLVLGDPGARDACIHALQACIPHQRVVPVGVKRFVSLGAPQGLLVAYGTERARAAGTFVFDVEVTDSEGRLWERWEGLTLRSIGPAPAREVWPAALLAPYLERRLGEVAPAAEISAAIETAAVNGDRRARSDAAMRQALGSEQLVHRRGNGKPEVEGRLAVSAAHLGDYTLGVAGAAPVACDLELVSPRDEVVWQGMLGRDRFELARRLCRETGEGMDAGATRVWAAAECSVKAGRPQPLTLASISTDGWALLRAGDAVVATLVTRLSTTPEPVALAVLVGERR
jgi:enediyne polyketide synthase